MSNDVDIVYNDIKGGFYETSLAQDAVHVVYQDCHAGEGGQTLSSCLHLVAS